MSFVDSILSALVSLRANILRSALTALGIIIGVAAVIVMVAVGAGAEYRVQSVIKSLGANIIIVQNGTRTAGGARGGAGTRNSLTEDDAHALNSELDAVQVAGASVRGAGQVVYGNANWFTALRGVTLEYMEAREWSVVDGRNMTQAEARSGAKVALVGQSVARELFGETPPVGQTIRIMRVPFRVIGVLGEKGQTPFGTDQDDVVMLPLKTAKGRVIGGRRVRGNLVGNITVKALSANMVAQAEREVTELLRTRHKLRPGQPDDFFIRNIAQVLEARAESSRIMSLLLASVAGVSLLVGGIGIMNIMLVSVTERTREIGLRMAVGARSAHILMQFVVEAVALSLIGGCIGILIGLSGSTVVARLAAWPMLVGPGAVAVAVVFSAAVGVFFGFYPARKASQLDPIEALRQE